jgi:ATP-dependent RNA helicase SUPV3L1/SUV3
LPAPFLAAAGFRSVGHRAIRLDMLDRLEEELERGVALGAQAETLLPKLVSLLGCSNDELSDVLAKLGWRVVDVVDSGQVSAKVWRKAREDRNRDNRKKTTRAEGRADSPFAELAALLRK